MKSLTPEQLEHLLQKSENPVDHNNLSPEDLRELQFFQAVDTALRNDLLHRGADSITLQVMNAIDALKPSFAERCLLVLQKNIIIVLLTSFGAFIAIFLYSYSATDPAMESQPYPQEWYIAQKFITLTSHSFESFTLETTAYLEQIVRTFIPFRSTNNLLFIFLALVLLYSLDWGLRTQKNRKI